LRQNQAGAISLPVWTSALLGIWLDVMENPRRSHVATFGISVAADMQGRGVGRRLMSEMINLCDNWLRIERIELTVFADNPRRCGL
jgi:putative acetyltransferase